MKRTAGYQDVMRAIREERLRVNTRTGVIEIRRPYPKARWLLASLELVKGPHQTKPYHRFSFGSGFRCLVHRAVWFVARGPITASLEINHKNGEKLQNGIGNLELGTGSNNVRHAFDTGLIVPARGRAAGRPNAKLSENDVRVIRASSTPQAELARRFGISQGQVSRARTRVTYAYVP